MKSVLVVFFLVFGGYSFVNRTQEVGSYSAFSTGTYWYSVNYQQIADIMCEIKLLETERHEKMYEYNNALDTAVRPFDSSLIFDNDKAARCRMLLNIIGVIDQAISVKRKKITDLWVRSRQEWGYHPQ